MKQPNRRYGNPREMAYYTQGRPLADIARALRRSERSVRDWLSGRQRVPWWVPEILRLKEMEHQQRMREMNMGRIAPRLHTVGGAVRDIRVIAPPPREPAAPVVELSTEKKSA